MAKYWSKVWNKKDVAVIMLTPIILLSYSISTVISFKISSPYALLIIDSSFVLGTIAVFLGLVIYKKIPLDKVGLCEPKTRWLVISIFLGIIFFAFGIILASIITSVFGSSANETDLSFNPTSEKMWLNILNFKLLIALGIPIAEEFIFRGVIFRFLRQHKTFFVSAIASSLLFGLLHLHPALMIFAFLIGLVSSVLYEKTGSILPSIVFHFAINNLAINMFLFSLLG